MAIEPRQLDAGRLVESLRVNAVVRDASDNVEFSGNPALLEATLHAGDDLGLDRKSVV